MSTSSMGSLASPGTSMLITSSSGTSSSDRFVLRRCSHSPDCQRVVAYGLSSCLPCSLMDPQSFARGCRNCLHPPITSAVIANVTTMASTPPQLEPSPSISQMSVASTRAASADGFHGAITAAVQQLMTAEQQATSPEEATEVHNLVDACKRLSFSPDRVHQEAHGNEIAKAAIPLVQICPRCEQQGHSRSQCRNPCARCNFAWPKCDIRCPMKFDQSTELLACADNQSPPVLTTNLDTEEFQLLSAAAIRSPLSGTPDRDVIDQFETVLRSKYLDKFPNIGEMSARTWITILDKGQMARLCRAVGDVEQTFSRFAVRGAGDTIATPKTVMWNEEAQASIKQSYIGLRDVTFAVKVELEELLKAIWNE